MKNLFFKVYVLSLKVVAASGFCKKGGSHPLIQSRYSLNGSDYLKVNVQSLFPVATSMSSTSSNILFIGIVLLAGVVLLLFFLYKKLNQKNKLAAEQKEEISQLKQLLKLKVLQTRVNPHFLFNSLNAIQYYINADDKKLSLQYISRFSVFLRNVIKYGDELYITLKDEAELLREYLWLEHTRFPGQFDYEINLPEDQQQVKILPLLTHGLVEAALYRGVLNLDDHKKGKILVDFSTTDDMLHVQVTNNGVDREKAEQMEKRKGMTVVEEDMLKRRIRLFNRQAKRKIHLEYETSEIMNGEAANRAKLEIPQPLFDAAIL
jgi:sensor histidine kinase YesM